MLPAERLLPKLVNYAHNFFLTIYLSLQIRLNSSKLELNTASTMTISEHSVSREETSSQEVVLFNLSTKMTKLIYKQQDNISSHNK